LDIKSSPCHRGGFSSC